MLKRANTPPFVTVRLRGHPSAIATLWDHFYLRHCRVEGSWTEAAFRLDVQGFAELPNHLLLFGFDLTVVEPDSLRTALVALAECWARHHQEKSSLP